MKHKRLTVLILAAFMLTSLAACNNAPTENNTQQSRTAAHASQNTSSEADTLTVTDTNSKTDTSADKAENKTLILYFSAGNSKNSDAISSATPTGNGYYSTQQLAVLIHDEVGGDLVALTPTNAYPLGYDETADQAKDEADSNARPQFEDIGVNMEDYDTIYFGYPIWWYTVPMIVNTFFDTYDFSGKTIIPFNTHAGSGDGGTYNTIRELEPNADVKEGLAVSGSSVFDEETKQQVKDRLLGLD